ncbi:MAG: DUF929 family protein [Gemmatimonadota bacterium]|nr:DUF929 family protein [Gemmatimonadota bacterium]
MASNPTRSPRSLNWLLVVVAVALVATISFAIERHHAAVETAAAATPPGPVPASVMASLTGITAETWDHAGVAGAAEPVFVGATEPQGAKPVVLYIGAGFCPYCAAARWSIITSLARFGTFSGLSYGASSAVDVYPSTPTFSFYGAGYFSEYVDFQSVELEGDVQMPNGQYQPLERPTPEQEALIEKYDKPPYVAASGAGGIPFVLIGGRYMWSGSPFSPGLLANQTQADIAATLPAGTGDAAHAILINGNQVTAAICAVDGNQPAAVCNTPVIQAAIKGLPAKTP